MERAKHLKYKKILRAMVLMGAVLTVGGMISSAGAAGVINNNSETTNMKENADSLNFEDRTYETRTMKVDGKNVTFRAYENIPYVANPVDTTYQSMNVYIPEAYFHNEKDHKYTAESAPIFLPNSVGGYRPGKAATPTLFKDGEPNAVLYALSRGLVVAAPAARGRSNETIEGVYYGKAPAAIVDLKAAVAYLHKNDKNMPGDANKIISNGTSAGGALSLLLGATGDEPDYAPYLQEIGAANARTDIFAVSAYCPITDLIDVDWLAYNTSVGRMKAPGAFDARDNFTGENNLFGTATIDNQHFTKFASFNGDGTAVADEHIIKMMNPLNYIKPNGSTEHWRIRYGEIDNNTSMAVTLIVATRLANYGYDVNFDLPWGIPHAGDYDLEELFDWIDKIVNE